MVNSSKKIGIQIPDFSSKFKNQFCPYSHGLTLLHSFLSLLLHQKRDPLRSKGSIRRPSDIGSGITEDTAFVQCIDGREPQIHEVWSLCLDRIVRKVHPTAQEEVPIGTIGEFVTDCLAEIRGKIQIIGKLSINSSVQFLGVLAQVWGHGLLFIRNLQDPAEATG